MISVTLAQVMYQPQDALHVTHAIHAVPVAHVVMMPVIPTAVGINLLS